MYVYEVNKLELVSIIIPLYNKEKYIEKTLLSAVNQSYKNIEILIINDGSTDNSRLICENFSFNHPNIRIIDQKNMGVSIARNRGIKEAKGKFISFLDADDFLNECFVNKLYNSIGNGNSVYCNHYYIKSEKKRKNRMNYKKGDIIVEYLYNRCTPNTNSWLIKKAFLLENNIFFPEDRDWGEDMTFFIKLLCHDTNINFVKEKLTIYNQDTELSLSTNSLNKINHDIYWLQDAIDYVESHITEERRRKHAIHAIKSYRIPGAIIYRLYQNKKKISTLNYNKIKEKYGVLLHSMDFTNGLKSLKLYIYYKFLI